ncbi:hypothetical protein NP233_g9846 [Leucocoprinus birnbaumii]|uniref:Replication protein A C-terminal domain-containing protein n=1 Tax=Leucocoprinus birnbaumii TaxID=56174 RepID=A0AAD5VN88_9AGAR|nr:hypothetical protein NP233_g9846 [Leucocoprinus birnbaumii]
MDTLDEYSNLRPLEQQIVRYLIAHGSKDGTHVGVIARSLGGGNVDAEKISEALDSLMDNGVLYNTIDDDHFALSR